MALLAVLLRSRVFWIVVIVLAAVTLATLSIVNYGNSRYSEGVTFEQGRQAEAVTQQTDTLSQELIKTQAESLKTLRGELATATAKLADADARNVDLVQTIGRLQNVKELNCNSLNPDTVRLFNKAACAYNFKYNIGESSASGGGCSQTNPTGKSDGSVSSHSGSSVGQH